MIAAIIRWSVANRFLVLLAVAAIMVGAWQTLQRLPLDAIPDLSDTQVIVFTEFPGQAAQLVEDQVTYPLTSALLTVPRAKAVRGISMFGVSFIYVIFADGTDIYWARSRVLEYLNTATRNLPQGVAPALGPDASGVGWVYQYVVKGGNLDLGQLRGIQDWTLRYALARADGVSEIAAVGGFVRQYQVTFDPNRLRILGLAPARVVEAIRNSNIDVGGRVVELSETEFVVRGRGYLRSLADLESLPLRASDGTAVRLGDVARIEVVPAERRGIAELNGDGEAVSGIAVQRFGQNALHVIGEVKKRLAEVASSLPAGVAIETVYDRSELIKRAIATLRTTLIEESIVVMLVCLVFLFHARSALVAVLVLPVGVAMALMATTWLGVSSNIMSLGGIAVAIGAMVDAAIVMIENAHKRLERAPPGANRASVVVEAAIEVGPSLFFSLLIITVSFVPIFALESQEGRLFGPLALTKTLAMAAAALLSVTLVPVLMHLFIRGRILPERSNPINRLLLALYRPVIDWALGNKLQVLAVAALFTAASVYPLTRLGSEFMPDLDEGTIMYMPTTLPGLSMTKAAELLQTQNRIIKQFPEVAVVIGKAGRAVTATDPAPTEMIETAITLKPKDQWRPGLTLEALIQEMDKSLQFPGVSNAWTMPIKARTDMLATGIRTPLGIKVYGRDLDEMERLARQIEATLKTVPGTASAYAERVGGGYYLNIEPDRAALARHNIDMSDFQSALRAAFGSGTATVTVEGRERYAVSTRYPQMLRGDLNAIARSVLVGAGDGMPVPLGEVATIGLSQGPTMLRTENAQLALYIFVDIRGRDLGGYVAEAQRTIAKNIAMPPGYFIEWSGQFEHLARAKARLAVLVPLTLVLILVLLYLNFRRLTETLIVMLSVPFALTGGLWLMYALDYNFSVAAVVGFIALAGVAAETGVVMLLYLDHAWRDQQAVAAVEGRTPDARDMSAAVIAGAVDRVRPKMMTVAAIMAGLMPILWQQGTGADIMRRIAVPMIGGMATSALLTLIVVPVIYTLVKRISLPVQPRSAPDPS